MPTRPIPRPKQKVARRAGLCVVRRISWLLVLGALACASPPPAPEAPTNVLLVVVDTLRADHLPLYGYLRPTAPRLTALAAQGAVFERAYAAAPWTLPSMISLMTGLDAGKLVPEDLEVLGIPEGVASLAERLRAGGYLTGAFVGNPTLHEGNGFSRGFDTFTVAPPSVEALKLHADWVNQGALPWLAEHQEQPFFLYLHYIDPHDPYDNPDLEAGKIPWVPPYSGALTGESVHALYGGQLTLEDPRRDVEYLTALYDGEIAYVDQRLGEVVAALRPEVLRRTLVVVTADHGEELYEHGGFKHGHTLYDDQIRVPLIVRWDRGGVAPGMRLVEPVSLLDVVPTVMAAVQPGPEDGSPALALDGQSLLPALLGREPLTRRSLFSQQLSWGPLRGAVVRGGGKLLLFNQREEFAPRDAAEEHLLALDRKRLPAVELVEVGSGAEGSRDLAKERPDAVRRLAPVAHRAFDAHLEGLRVILGAGDGAAVEGRLVLERPPERWVPYFLEEGDRVELRGKEVVFSLRPGLLARGFRLLGNLGGVEELSAATADGALPPERLRYGGGVPYKGGSLSPQQLEAPPWPPGGAGEGLFIWRRSPRPVAATNGEETHRRLKALGYL